MDAGGPLRPEPLSRGVQAPPLPLPEGIETDLAPVGVAREHQIQRIGRQEPALILRLVAQQDPVAVLPAEFLQSPQVRRGDGTFDGVKIPVRLRRRRAVGGEEPPVLDDPGRGQPADLHAAVFRPGVVQDMRAGRRDALQVPVGVRTFLEDNELKRLIHNIDNHEFDILLVESQPENVDYRFEKIIIDHDLCEL